MAKEKKAAGDMNRPLAQPSAKTWVNPTEKTKSARKAPAGSAMANNSAKVSSDRVSKKPKNAKAAKIAKTISKKSGSIEPAFKKITAKTKSAVSNRTGDFVEDPKSDVKPDETKPDGNAIFGDDLTVYGGTPNSAAANESENSDDEDEFDDDESDEDNFDEEDVDEEDVDEEDVDEEDVDEENVDEENLEERDGVEYQNPLSIPKPKRCKWKQHKEPDKNGRYSGRQLVLWHRPRMIEKLFLHLQYECQRANISLPWEKTVHRLMPGSSGTAACQHLAKVRKQLIREGHLVPPLIGKLGTKQDPDIRGKMRDTPGGPVRTIFWDDKIVDRKESLLDGAVRGSGQYRKVEVEIRRQAKIDLEKLIEEGGDERKVQKLKELVEYKHTPLRKRDGNQARRNKAQTVKSLSSPQEKDTRVEPNPIVSTPKKHARTRGMSEPDEVASEVELDSDADYSPTVAKRPRTSAVRKSTRNSKAVKADTSTQPELFEEEKSPATVVAATPAKPAMASVAKKPTAVPETPVKPKMATSKKPTAVPETPVKPNVATSKKPTAAPETPVKPKMATSKKPTAVPETPVKPNVATSKKPTTVPRTAGKINKVASSKKSTIVPAKSAVATHVEASSGSDNGLAKLISSAVEDDGVAVALGDEETHSQLVIDGNKQTSEDKADKINQFVAPSSEALAEHSDFKTTDPLARETSSEHDIFADGSSSDDKPAAARVVTQYTVPDPHPMSFLLPVPQSPLLGYSFMGTIPPAAGFNLFEDASHFFGEEATPLAQQQMGYMGSQLTEHSSQVPQTVTPESRGFGDGVYDPYLMTPNPDIDKFNLDMFTEE